MQSDSNHSDTTLVCPLHLKLSLRGSSMAVVPCGIDSKLLNLKEDFQPNRRYTISKFQPGHDEEVFEEVYKSEVVSNTRNPVWKEATIPLNDVCNGDCDLPISLSVWEHCEDANRSLPMGSIQTTVAELMRATENPMYVLTLTRGNRFMGTITVTQAEIVDLHNAQISEEQPPSEDWFSGALELLQFTEEQLSSEDWFSGAVAILTNLFVIPEDDGTKSTIEEDGPRQARTRANSCDSATTGVEEVLSAAHKAIRVRQRSGGIHFTRPDVSHDDDEVTIADIVSVAKEALRRGKSDSSERPQPSRLEQILKDMPEWNLDGDNEKEWVNDKRNRKKKQPASKESSFAAAWDHTFWEKAPEAAQDTSITPQKKKTRRSKPSFPKNEPRRRAQRRGSCPVASSSNLKSDQERREGRRKPSGASERKERTCGASERRERTSGRKRTTSSKKEAQMSLADRVELELLKKAKAPKKLKRKATKKPSEKVEWACHMCTFVNCRKQKPDLKLRCKMCHTTIISGPAEKNKETTPKRSKSSTARMSAESKEQLRKAQSMRRVSDMAKEMGNLQAKRVRLVGKKK